jgi:hypothetical protein
LVTLSKDRLATCISMPLRNIIYVLVGIAITGQDSYISIVLVGISVYGREMSVRDKDLVPHAIFYQKLH